MIQRKHFIIHMAEDPTGGKLMFRAQVGIVAIHEVESSRVVVSVNRAKTVQKKGADEAISKLLFALYGDLISKSKEEFLEELYKLGMPRVEYNKGDDES